MTKVKGKGSVIQVDKSVPRSKCRKWELRVSVGRDLASGTYKPVTRRFHGSLSEANRALRGLIDDIERDGAMRRCDMAFGEYCDAWIEERRGSVAWGTVRRDVDRLKNVRLHLEKAHLHEITPAALEGVYRRLQQGESVSGKPLSPGYVACIATSLHTMFRRAVLDGHMASNPCDYAKRPKASRKERGSIRARDMRRLLEQLDASDPLQLVVIIALRTGMRRGEVHGLSWCDIDYDDMVIHVRHNFADNGELGDPKTESGHRDIPLPPSLVADLEIRRDNMERLARRYGIEVRGDSPIICNGLLERMLPHSTTRWWTRNRERLGFPGLTIHELRHSFLSEMARRKVDPKVLQKLAGHAKYSTTMEIYTHVDMEDERAAMEKMDW